VIDGLTAALSGAITSRWRNTALGTVAAVWLVFAGLWAAAHPGAYHCAHRGTAACRLYEAQPVGSALILLIAVCAVAGSAFAAASLAPRLFALLTTDAWLRGPRPVVRIGLFLTRRQLARRDRLMRRFEAHDQSPGGYSQFGLAGRRTSVLGAAVSERWPARPQLMRTSACGNTLAATAERVETTFGLNLSHAWQPLLATLPQETWDRLAARSAAVLARCQQFLLLLAALPLAGLLPWPSAGAWLVGCGIVALTCYRGLTLETRAFAAQIHTTVVVHRAGLYTALGLQPPAGAAAEVAAGSQLTQVLSALQDLDAPPAATYSW
jgi:hypothetical protein